MNIKIPTIDEISSVYFGSLVHRDEILRQLSIITCYDVLSSTSVSSVGRWLNKCIEEIAAEMDWDSVAVERDYFISGVTVNQDGRAWAHFIMPRSECEAIWGSTVDEKIGLQNCLVRVDSSGIPFRVSNGQSLTPVQPSFTHVFVPGKTYVVPKLRTNAQGEWCFSNLLETT
jgi:hypothetical protein